MSDTPQPPLPYSYFRAEGQSLDQVLTVEDAQRTLEKMKRDLCKRFGANELIGGFDAAKGRFRLTTFHFTPAQEGNVPPDWDVSNRQVSGGELQAIFAKPAAGSPDDFFITDYCGLMERAARRSRLENVFGCGDMPMRERGAGHYHTAFVRDRVMNDKPNDYNQDGIGHIKEHFGFMSYSNSATRGSDPLEVMEMLGNWYIRVPNDENGQPRMTPVDAVQVTVADALALDKEERAQRFARTQARAFDPHI